MNGKNSFICISAMLTIIQKNVLVRKLCEKQGRNFDKLEDADIDPMRLLLTNVTPADILDTLDWLLDDEDEE